MMMGQTIRDLGSTIKEAKATINAQQKNSHIAEDEDEEFEGSQQQHQESMN